MQRVLVINQVVQNNISRHYIALFVAVALAFSAQPAGAFATDAISAAPAGLNPLHIAFFGLTVISMVLWQTRPQID